jgi:hypothetical protein
MATKNATVTFASSWSIRCWSDLTWTVTNSYNNTIGKFSKFSNRMSLSYEQFSVNQSPIRPWKMKYMSAEWPRECISRYLKFWLKDSRRILKSLYRKSMEFCPNFRKCSHSILTKIRRSLRPKYRPWYLDRYLKLKMTKAIILRNTSETHKTFKWNSHSSEKCKSC